MDEFLTSNWQFESELLTEKPRPVSYRLFFYNNFEDYFLLSATGFMSLLLGWFVVTHVRLDSFLIFLLFVLPFLYLIFSIRKELSIHKYLTAQGDPICGKVEKYSLFRWSARKHRLQPFVSYEYQGRHYFEKVVGTTAWWSGVTKGRNITLLVDPNNPHICAIYVSMR